MKKKIYILGVPLLAAIVCTQSAFAATFGRTTDYTTACIVSSNADGKTAILATLSENGTVSKVTASLAKQTTNRNAKAVIYSENPADAPDALLATSDAVLITSTTFSWIDFTFPTPVALTAGDYFLGIIGEGATSDVVQIHCQDIDAGINRFNLDTYSDGPSNPFGTPSTSVNEKSIYATYTAQSAATTSSAFVTGADISIQGAEIIIL